MTTAIEKKPNGSDLVLTPLEPQKLTPMDLLQVALSKDAAIDVIERLAKLQLDMRKLDAEVEFNEALSACQQEVQLVVVDSDKAGPGGKKWATYKALDKAIRPIYISRGFSLSFGTSDYTVPEQILVTCLVSRGMHTRTYQLPMDASGKGPQGAGALSKPHAILAAMEYGRRCLLKSIFNIVTGEEDAVTTNKEVMLAMAKIEDAGDIDMMMHYYREAYKTFENSPEAIKIIVETKLKRQAALQKKKEAANVRR